MRPIDRPHITLFPSGGIELRSLRKSWSRRMTCANLIRAMGDRRLRPSVRWRRKKGQVGPFMRTNRRRSIDRSGRRLTVGRADGAEDGRIDGYRALRHDRGAHAQRPLQRIASRGRLGGFAREALPRTCREFAQVRCNAGKTALLSVYVSAEGMATDGNSQSCVAKGGVRIGIRSETSASAMRGGQVFLRGA
jgi:hypothetical protein